MVPKAMGSRATFEMGKLGGLSGRKLHQGDLVTLGDQQPAKLMDSKPLSCFHLPIPQRPNVKWEIGVIPGPHGSPEFFAEDGLVSLFKDEWHVHHNSNRCGIRLTGPKPQWTRQTGGAAGLHPSNIHDSPYSIRSVSFTGDEAVVPTCDGPGLGGSVVFCVVASAEMWKLGQVRPGDCIRFVPMSIDTALRLDAEVDKAICDLTDIPTLITSSSAQEATEDLLASTIPCNGVVMIAKQAGDHAMLLEFGDTDDFSLRQSFYIHAFCENHKQAPVPGIVELTPGVRTLHVRYAAGLTRPVIIERISRHVETCAFQTKVPSRIIHLPLAFDDSASRAAIARYEATI